MNLVNFNQFQVRKKTYGGANGNKLSICIGDSLYMLKLPFHATKNKNLSYTNSCISEYLGSHIFNMIGIKAQETILGEYEYNGVKRISVACKDFEEDGYVIKDFASVKNQIIDSKSNGYGTDINEILETIEQQSLIDPVFLSNTFWEMFVIDALLGNWDRHNGNWGFLYNQGTDDIKIAPIFDCGSCLFPQIDDDIIDTIMKNKSQLNARIFNFPTSALLYNGKRINYYDFIQNHEFKECDNAIIRIKNKINFDDINLLIDDIPCISVKHKNFLKLIIKKRFDAYFN